VKLAPSSAPVARRYGKTLDVARLKQPVLANLTAHADEIAAMAEYLAQHEEKEPQPVCYICGSATSTAMARIHGFEYVRCGDCDHVYTTARYSQQAIQRFYERNEYYSRITYANRDTCEYRREHVARPKVAFTEEYSGRASGSWLDVGSGVGDVVSVLVEHGWRATGLELSSTSAAFARETFGVDLLPCTLADYDDAHRAQRGTLDVISFLGILEHVTDPIDLLTRAARMLEPRGHLLIQVPNANSISSRIQTVFPEHVFRHMSPVSHIMLFTEHSLTRALALTGFEPVAFWFLGLDVYELLNTLVLTNSRVEGSALQSALLAHMDGLQAVFDRAELGDGIICVAKRKAA
jgi:2-polyprenyl-3-methyl-5-hydroxy-6-metoxy-1,4-benzoquinol methylase